MMYLISDIKLWERTRSKEDLNHICLKVEI